LDIPAHVLRFWETKFPNLKPLTRRGGRRYYRPADIDLLQTIKRLLYEEGFTIKGAQKFLDQRRNLDELAKAPAADRAVKTQDINALHALRTEIAALAIEARQVAGGGIPRTETDKD